MSFTTELHTSFVNNKTSRAFCIDGQDISYEEFLEYINGTRALLDKKIKGTNNPIGIIAHECIETYAAIFACWFSGNHFVPLNPKFPAEKNLSIIRNTGIEYILSPREEAEEFSKASLKLKIIVNKGVKSKEDSEPALAGEDQRMYVLSTSGSTGTPKYVPISQENLSTYCYGFIDRFPELDSEACFLQIYDHTFDAAFTSYLVPLMVGACVYTLPDGQFKFLSIAKLLSDRKVNWVKLTPSVLSYLSPYKAQLDFGHLHTLIFGGEALPLALVNEWSKVFPKTRIVNHYGPTETTVGVTSYTIHEDKKIRAMNGIVSIGKPFKEVGYAIIGKNGEEVDPGQKGELCIGGKQVMKGYLNDDGYPFIEKMIDGKISRFYKTGDMVQTDLDGYIYFLGRSDDQVKIGGFRVDLVEVENAVRKAGKFETGVAAVAVEKTPGLNQLIVFVENYSGDGLDIIKKLALQIQPYQIPARVVGVRAFPLNSSGKTDKKSLVAHFKSSEK